MRNNKDSLERIHALNAQNESTIITLLCYEREGEHCHRHIVRDTIEKSTAFIGTTILHNHPLQRYSLTPPPLSQRVSCYSRDIFKLWKTSVDIKTKLRETDAFTIQKTNHYLYE